MTVLTQRAGTAMTNAGRVQNAQGPVALRSAFLHKERMASRATQRSVRLQRERGARKAVSKGRACPLWWPVGHLGI